MAYFKIKRITTRLDHCIDYIINPKKADQLDIIRHGAMSTGQSTALMWEFEKEQKSKVSDNLGYHIMYSFAPNEVNKEEAYFIVQELLQKAYPNLKYIMSLHTDKKHIHAHIIIDNLDINTNKIYDLRFKNELIKLNKLNQQIMKSRGKEPKCQYSGVGIKSMTYFEWMQERANKRSGKTILKETIKYLLPKCKDLASLEKVLTNLGYTVQDNFSAKEDADVRKLTVNIEKLVIEDMETEDTVSFYVPKTKRKQILTINKKHIKFLTDNTLEASILKNENNYTITDTNGNVIDTSIENLFLNYEDKTKQGRESISIKIAGSNYFIRTTSLNDKWNRDYFNDRFNNQKLLFNDPKLRDILSREFNSDNVKLNKKEFEAYSKIEDKYKRKPYTAYERYIFYKSKQISKKLSILHQINNPTAQVDKKEESIRQIDSSLYLLNKDELKLKIKEHKEELKNGEKLYKELLKDELEGMLDVNDEEKEMFIEKNLTYHELQIKDIQKVIKEKTEKELEKSEQNASHFVR